MIMINYELIIKTKTFLSKFIPYQEKIKKVIKWQK